MNESVDFTEFSPTSYEQWKEVVTKELGGRAFEDLFWKPFDQLQIEPYHSEIYKKLELVRPTSNEITISQSFSSSRKHCNEDVLNSLMGGVNHLVFQINDTTPYSEITKGIHFEFIETTVELRSGYLSEGLEFISQFLLHNDQLGDFKLNVRIPYQLINDAKLLQKIYSLFQSSRKRWRPFVIDLALLEDFALEPYKSSSIGLSCGRRLLDVLLEKECLLDDALAMIGFHFGTSTSYFVEISKYQVYRTLWSIIASEYRPHHSCSKNTYLTARGSMFTFSNLDIFNNLLRTTTQAMSAFLGGVDSIEAMPYDHIQEESSNGLRWARNVIHLLIEESHFVEARNAAAGSYFIENLNVELAELAWSEFKSFEKFSNQDFISSIETYKKERNQVVRNEYKNNIKTLLGVNKYPNKSDVAMLSRMETTSEFRAAYEFEISREKEVRS